ncbi:MAG: ribokinase [Anaerolineae bacterium]|nr:ribokinase [Anaerolineae bacterium]
MLNLSTFEKIDYLVIGHISLDLTPAGEQLGGTAAYAALTARALGLRVGVVTSFNPDDISLEAFKDILVCGFPSKETTSFKIDDSSTNRQLMLKGRAAQIQFEQVPKAWQRTPIIHLGPIVQEIDSQLPAGFAPALLGLTPQGWLRSWGPDGHVEPKKWTQMEASLNKASAAVLSIEDIWDDEEIIEEISLASRVLALTEGSAGARIYWNHDLRRFPAPSMDVVDPIGAGDIFAAAFFIRLHSTRDPWEAARFATRLATYSVSRRGLAGIPTEEEIQQCQMEVY